ncbi:MAG: ATP-dependent helicase UvrD/PcrA [Solirubrobacteraceae bacterium]
MASADIALSSLDDRQRRAVQHAQGPIAVIAGAGTGKTRVLVARVAWLIARGHARPSEICALTFMNDSALEIAERLEQALGARVAGAITVATSHRLANALLRSCAARFERPGRYSIWDGDQARRALDHALTEAPEPTAAATAVRARASDAAARLWSPWQAAAKAPDDPAHSLWAGLIAYERAKRASSAFDFDDLLLHAAVALESDAMLRTRLARRVRHVLLDEVQDTNHAQYRIVALLAAEHRNLMILGDPDQAICTYRGATSEENFAAFARDFPEHEVVTLERNYRSTATILRAANALISHNRGRIEKRLWTAGPTGEPIEVDAFDDELEEAEGIAVWARGHLDAGVTPGALCVLVRVNQLGQAIEQALISARVPVRAANAVGFYQRAEVRNALAALALVANPRDRLAFARTAQAAGAGVGPAACRALFARADEDPRRTLLEHGADADIDGLSSRQRKAVGRLCTGLCSVAERIDARPDQVARHVVDALVASGQPARLARAVGASANDRAPYRTRGALERLRELARHARAYEASAPRPDLGDFLAGLTLAARESAGDGRALSIMTIHKAKGLEFDHVWIAGMEEDLLPHARSVRSGLEPEERRLAYVAVTRARRTLHASWAADRGGRQRERSRYLHDMRPPTPGPVS